MASADTSQTVATYTDDGTAYEVDHLGIGLDSQWGLFHAWTGGNCVGEFELPDVATSHGPLPPSLVLIMHAKHAVATELAAENGLEYPSPGAPIPPELNGGMPGYVVGECLHRMAGSDWRAGLRNCERCGG